MGLIVRGKLAFVRKHAHEGMACERPPVSLDDVLLALEEPDHDDGEQAWRWIGGRTVLVYYREDEEGVVVRSVSATRRRLRA